jgi:transcriptional regulator with XRE-family HTH domain
MRDDRVGRIVRELRVRNGWRQRDLATRAGVSQRLVAEIELGRIEGVTVGRLRMVGKALDIDMSVDAWWRRGDIDRLLDRGHAAIVEFVMRRLVDGGWLVLPEVTFNHYGDRGSVDIVAWHEVTATLLLIEVKTRITDVQALHSTFARKVRIVPDLMTSEHGWKPSSVARMLVVADTHGAREIVRRHATTFDAVWRARTRACQRRIDAPTTASTGWGGIWFLDPASMGRSAAQVAGAPRRVRVRRPSAPTRGGT